VKNTDQPKYVNITGHRIRQARLKHNPPVTQNELLAMLKKHGVLLDQSAVSRIESRQRGVMDREVAAIARCLQVSVSWLFGAKVR